MHGSVETITELFTAATASTLSAVESHALPTVIYLLSFAAGALAVGWILGKLEDALPQPVGRPSIIAAWCRRSLRWAAVACLFIALFLGWGLRRADETLRHTLSQFEQELDGRSETGWQREVFSLAAQRIAELGPDYARATEEARRGGLHLPISDSAAARVLYAVATEKTLERWRKETRWGYRLWRGLPQRVDVPAIPRPNTVADGPMIVGSDPATSPLVRSGIEDAVNQVRSALSSRIATYAGISRFHLWRPAVVTVSLAFLALCTAASIRLEARFRALRSLP